MQRRSASPSPTGSSARTGRSSSFVTKMFSGRAKSKKTDEPQEKEMKGLLPSQNVTAPKSSSRTVSIFSTKSPVRKAVQLARPFFTGAKRKQAFCLSLTLVFAMLAETGLFVHFSEVQKNYMTALQQKDEAGFKYGLSQVAMIIAIFVPVIGLHGFSQESLNIEWRRHLTHSLSQQYFGSEVTGASAPFYRLYLTSDVDNPDQRICQDCPMIIGSVVQLVLDVGSTVMRMMAFAKVLYDISPTVCAGVVGYTLFGTVVSAKCFGPSIMSYQTETLTKEATLRYSLIRVRENAESVAFFRGGTAELQRFETLVFSLIQTLYGKLWLMTGFGMFLRTFQFATFAVPAMTVGPAYLRGEVEFGAISQCSMAFNVMMEGLMLVMKQQERFSTIAVQVERVSALQEALEAEALAIVANQSSGVKSYTAIAHIENAAPDNTVALAVRRVTVRTPVRQGSASLQQTLIQDLDLQVMLGQRLLIAGDSGAGKSSFLRAIAGLWSEGSGTIETGVRSTLFFMPQRPYMCVGSLRSQLLYPLEEDLRVTEKDLRQTLSLVNLGYLLDQHNFSDLKDWASILSLGEQQRVNFARILLQPRVQVVLLDEGTSACDPQNERVLYGLLASKVQSYISVGHRPALRQFHTHALLMRRSANSGSGSLTPAASSQGSSSFSYMPMDEFEKTGVWSELA